MYEEIKTLTFEFCLLNMTDYIHSFFTPTVEGPGRPGLLDEGREPPHQRPGRGSLGGLPGGSREEGWRRRRQRRAGRRSRWKR